MILLEGSKGGKNLNVNGFSFVSRFVARMSLRGILATWQCSAIVLLTASCLLLSAASFAGEYDAEITKQQEIIAQNPTNLDAAYYLGNYLAWDGRYEEAIQVFKDILAKKSDYIDADIGIARAYAWKGDRKKAVEKYEEIIKKDPDNFEVHQGLGSLALWINNFEESIKYFKQALIINPKDIVSLKGIGRAYLGRGDRRRAEEYFSKAQILEIKQTPMSIILAVIAGVVFIVLIIVFIIRSRIRHRKKATLRLELKILRYALSLYHQTADKFPLALENLMQEKWRPPGEAEDRPYLDSIHQGDRGFLVDPFGNRYWYNPDTGGVYSTTRGCNKW